LSIGPSPRCEGGKKGILCPCYYSRCVLRWNIILFDPCWRWARGANSPRRGWTCGRLPRPGQAPDRPTTGARTRAPNGKPIERTQCTKTRVLFGCRPIAIDCGTDLTARTCQRAGSQRVRGRRASANGSTARRVRRSSIGGKCSQPPSTLLNASNEQSGATTFFKPHVVHVHSVGYFFLPFVKHKLK